MQDLLLIEDDPNDVELTRRAFRRLGLDARLDVLSDGAEAVKQLDACAATGGLPKAVFLDLKLPGMSGIDVLRTIRRNGRLSSLPVVILTSSGLLADITACYEHGANSYVVKPVDPGEFRRVVETLGLYWGEMNQVKLD